MKVLYFTKYSRNGASSRLRSYQYFPFLVEEGIEVSVSPFFDENYLVDLYAEKKSSKVKLLKYYFKRFFQLFTIYKYDKIVIEKELFPYFFSWFERILFVLNVNYIVDYDDAIFHNYDLNKNPLISFFLKNKIANVMKYSECVLAGNNYLAQKAKDSGADKVVILPTAIDTSRYTTKTNYTDSPLVIGWIGTPSTYKYIEKFEPTFLKLNKLYGVQLHIVGVKQNGFFSDSIHFIDWSEETEVDLIAKFDIGVMPLENTAWELGKCSYKLIQYMGCGIPVVASAIGMNNEVVEEGKNGFLVTEKSEWIEKIGLLITDLNLRKEFGKNGKIKANQKFCLQSNLSILTSVIKNEEFSKSLLPRYTANI